MLYEEGGDFDNNKVFMCVKNKGCPLCTKLRKEVRRAHTKLCEFDKEFIEAFSFHSAALYRLKKNNPLRTYHMFRVTSSHRLEVNYAQISLMQNWNLEGEKENVNHALFVVPNILESIRTFHVRHNKRAYTPTAEWEIAEKFEKIFPNRYRDKLLSAI